MARPLSPRQKQVTILAARGLGYKGIALSMGITEQTVKNMIGEAREKYDAPNVTALVARAVIMGEITWRDLCEVVDVKRRL